MNPSKDHLLLAPIKYFSRGLIENEQNITRTQEKIYILEGLKQNNKDQKQNFCFIRNSMPNFFIRDQKQNLLIYQGPKTYLSL